MARHGEGVLFVLDGWDEFAPGLCGDTLVQKLICRPHLLQLSCSTLVITSRPIASAQLQQYASTRVEIVGFTPNEVTKYFQEVLGDSKCFAELDSQLQERPVIKASCYLPLNATIVVHLFKELNQILPTTLQGMFSALVCGCLLRHLRKDFKTHKVTSVPSLEDIPPVIAQPFKNVCMLAYEGVKNDKVTFTVKDLTSYDLPLEINVLSLMQGVESFASKKSKLYHFLHLSVQELLAAFHISNLSPPEQVQVFQDLFDQPRFAAVFRFYAAFTKLQTEGVRDIVVGIVQSRSKDRLLNLLHCLYEAQDQSLCTFVASQLNAGLNLGGCTLSPLDCLTVGYFLSCVYLARQGDFEVDFEHCSLTDYSLRFLVKELSKSVQSYLHVQVTAASSGCLLLSLILSDNDIHGGGVRCLSELISHSSGVNTLDLSRNRIQEEEDGLMFLLEGLRTNTSIEKLKLQDCSLRITDGNGPLLVNVLRENTTLETLNMSGNMIQEDEDGLENLLEGLRTNTSIEILELCHCSLKITDNNGPLLVNMLKENNRLKKLNLSDNQIQKDVDGLAYLLEGLKSNTSILIVVLEHRSLTFNEDTGLMLVDLLKTNRTLQVLCVNGEDECKRDVEYRTSSSRKGLLKLYLVACGLTDAITHSIVPVIREHTSLEVLDLNCNDVMSDTGTAAVAEVLRHSHSLRQLNIGNFGVTDQGVESIAAALEVNSTLEELDLFGSDWITDRGLVTLGESLKKSKGLKKLVLEMCDSTTEKGWMQLKCDVESLNETRKRQGLPILELRK